MYIYISYIIYPSKILGGYVSSIRKKKKQLSKKRSFPGSAFKQMQ